MVIKLFRAHHNRIHNIHHNVGIWYGIWLCYHRTGIKVREGMAYNPYFAGGLIGMPPPLTDGQLDYEDGTPATTSQMVSSCYTSSRPPNILIMPA
jgi:cytochrome c1